MSTKEEDCFAIFVIGGYLLICLIEVMYWYGFFNYGH